MKKSVYLSDYLMHYQIVGAKHGVRRFQNEDGSLTPAGRLRYGYTDSGSSQQVNRLLPMKSGPTVPMDQQTAKQFNFEMEAKKQLPGYGQSGHSYREISEEEYNRINDSMNKILDDSSNATPQRVQSSVLAGQQAVQQLVSKTTKKKKKVKSRMITSSSRTLNEKTKNLTSLNDQKYLKDLFK